MTLTPRRLLVAAGALGAVHALSFAPWPAWWLQIGCLAIMLRLALSPQAGSARSAAMLGLTFGIGHYAAGLCWLYISMHRYGGMPMPMAALAVLIFAAYLAIFTALAMLVANRLINAHARPLDAATGLAWAGALAGAWTLADILRGWLFTGFPWLSVGYAHVDGPLSALAGWLGVYGVGMVAVWVAALVALALCAAAPRARWTWAALGAGSVLITLPLSGLHLTQPAGPPVSVRLVQGNVPQQLKFDPARSDNAMRAYAQRIAEGSASLTVLPETAWTMPWSSTPAGVRETITDALRGGARAVALGAPAIEVDANVTRITNSVLLLAEGPTGVISRARYDKHHLVPFGEFIPWGFDWFVKMMRIPLGSFARGALAQAPFEVGGQRFAINICYEDLFGEEIIESVRSPVGASILVNVSNIAWFGDSHALPQHLEIARMRTLETGRPMLRATNTGVTASIDHRGKVLARLPHHQEGVLDVSVQGTDGLTPYVRAGNLPVIALALTALMAGWLALRRRAPIQ